MNKVNYLVFIYYYYQYNPKYLVLYKYIKEVIPPVGDGNTKL